MRDPGPLSKLVLRTPRLELRLPSEAELRALAAIALGGVHPPERMPFLIPWTDPSPTFVDDFLGYHRRVRASWRPDDWRVEFAVFAAEGPVGVQAITAQRFAQDRTTGSASWLAAAHQGHGYGTEMRTAILELAFSGLGARRAVTGAFVDNPASARVSIKLGYVKDGTRRPRVRGRPVREDRFALTRDRFLASQRIPVTLEGVAACRPLFGLRAGAPEPSDRVEAGRRGSAGR